VASLQAEVRPELSDAQYVPAEHRPISQEEEVELHSPDLPGVIHLELSDVQYAQAEHLPKSLMEEVVLHIQDQQEESEESVAQ
jgi:hypothetical protein